MKRFFSVYLVLCIILTLGISVSAAEAVPYVDDQAGILTSQEIYDLRNLASKASHDTGCGIYIITVEDYRDLRQESSEPISQVLLRYYMEQGYGLGDDRDGVILMLSMADRDYSLFTNGFGDSGLSDPAMDYLVERFLRDFSHDSWYNGFKHYITCTDDLLQMTIDGHPFDESTPTGGELLLGWILCILISLIIASLVTNHFVRKMKSVALETDAEEFAEDLHLTDQNDRYVNTTTTRVYDPPQTSGSSGGGSSGGGGGGCSRSGKF